MPDHRVSDEFVLRTARLVNEVEDVRKQANDDLKTIWQDAREELRGAGMPGKEISREVGYLKAAIAETRLTAEDREKAIEKQDGVDVYMAILTAPRARARVRADLVTTPNASNSGDDKAISDELSTAPETEPQADPQPVQPLPVDPVDTEPDGRSGGESPVENPRAKASTGNGTYPARLEGHGATGDVSRLDAGRTASATSERRDVTSPGGENPAPNSDHEATTAVGAPASAAPASRQWTYSDPAHPRCLDPDFCGGHSNLGLCLRCKAAAGLIGSDAA